MIPEQNVNHVIVRTLFEPAKNPINDLFEALQNANILPHRVPVSGGTGVYRHIITRLDLELVAKYRLYFGDIRLDAFVEELAPGGNEVRLGVPLKEALFQLSVLEASSGREVTSIQYALSGRAFIYGSITVNSTTGAPFFTVSRLPEFKLDDWTQDIPLVVGRGDIEMMVSRMISRDVRARPATAERPGMISFPISFQVDDLLDTSPLSFGLSLRNTVAAIDPMSVELCLPQGGGSQTCGENQGTERSFYSHLDTFLRVATTSDPVDLYPVNRAIQVNVGWRVIDRELRRENGWEKWKEVAEKMFRFRVGHSTNWRRHDDGTGSIYLEVEASLQVAYPKVKWCRGWTKTPFGKFKYKYPCGVKRGWHGVKDMRAWVDARVNMQDDKACLQILDSDSEGSNDIIGYLITGTYLIAAASLVAIIPFLGPMLAGTVAAAGSLVMLVLLSVDKVLGLILKFVPGQVCANIEKFLTLPLFDDKLEIELNRGEIEFLRNGLSISVDPDFDAVLVNTDPFVEVELTDAAK